MKQHIDTLRSAYGDLSSAVEAYFDELHKETYTNSVSNDRTWLINLKMIIYSSHDDDLSKKVEDSITSLSQLMKTYTLSGNKKVKSSSMNKMNSTKENELSNNIKRSWILSQATAYFLVSFVFLKALTLQHSPKWKLIGDFYVPSYAFPNYVYTTLSLITLTIAIVLITTLFIGRLRSLVLGKLTWLSVAFAPALILGFVFSWLRGIEPLPGTSVLLFHIFFYIGCIWILLLFVDSLLKIWHQIGQHTNTSNEKQNTN